MVWGLVIIGELSGKESKEFNYCYTTTPPQVGQSLQLM